jgi:hypothetical protein
MSEPQINKQTAVLAIMADAAYEGNNGQGANSRERINNYLAIAAQRNPGLASEIAKYEIIQSNKNMFAVVNHAEKKIIVSFRGTDKSNWADFAHDFAIAADVHLANNFTGAIAKAGSNVLSALSTAIGFKPIEIPHRFNSALSFTEQ